LNCLEADSPPEDAISYPLIFPAQNNEGKPDRAAILVKQDSSIENVNGRETMSRYSPPPLLDDEPGFNFQGTTTLRFLSISGF
jgi:hypothetical protein